MECGAITESVPISKPAIYDLPMANIMNRDTFCRGIHLIDYAIISDANSIMS